ncbi:hypothetical protein CC80DRAFT_501281 [Byssothecium circinans]|uniref:Uncharacterized protein n=1 Tax=Byssothecium circinans TaxID=147558 RepID=A0A6A5UB61_9PLEO|nr:hypothetical protein CC80DRAFT_501281 [Byssothecium circinans]
MGTCDARYLIAPIYHIHITVNTDGDWTTNIFAEDSAASQSAPQFHKGFSERWSNYWKSVKTDKTNPEYPGDAFYDILGFKNQTRRINAAEKKAMAQPVRNVQEEAQKRNLRVPSKSEGIQMVNLVESAKVAVAQALNISQDERSFYVLVSRSGNTAQAEIFKVGQGKSIAMGTGNDQFRALRNLEGLVNACYHRAQGRKW